jgi:hypothetical protein
MKSLIAMPITQALADRLFFALRRSAPNGDARVFSSQSVENMNACLLLIRTKGLIVFFLRNRRIIRYTQFRIFLRAQITKFGTDGGDSSARTCNYLEDTFDALHCPEDSLPLVAT